MGCLIKVRLIPLISNQNKIFVTTHLLSSLGIKRCRILDKPLKFETKLGKSKVGMIDKKWKGWKCKSQTKTDKISFFAILDKELKYNSNFTTTRKLWVKTRFSGFQTLRNLSLTKIMTLMKRRWLNRRVSLNNNFKPPRDRYWRCHPNSPIPCSKAIR